MKILINKEQLALINEAILNERIDTMEAIDVEGAAERFGDLAVELGICGLNEGEILSEGILDTLKQTFTKGVLIASAAVALGVLSPQEAQAQIGSAPDNKIVNIFKDKANKQCQQVGKQKKLSKGQKPTTGVDVFKAEYKNPKFDTGDTAPQAKYFVKNKAGDYKEISQQQLEKLKKRKNISVKQIKGKELRTAIQQNK